VTIDFSQCYKLEQNPSDIGCPFKYYPLETIDSSRKYYFRPPCGWSLETLRRRGLKKPNFLKESMNLS